MTDQLVKVSQLKAALSELYSLETHFASTRSADLYKAFDKSLNIAASLWVLRHPLALHSQGVDRFIARMQAVQKLLRSSPCHVLDFGVDNAGMAFAALPPLDGVPFYSGTREVPEIERRFMAAVRLVSEFHNRGIVFGDLCHSSFWLDRSGEVWLVGVMGSFDSEAVATAMMPPLETLHYVAPEQRAGGGAEQASDVFALGVLGYFLFTGQFPLGQGDEVFSQALDLSRVEPVSKYLSAPPAWADDIFRRCINPAPEKRFPSARALFEGIMQARSHALMQSELPVKSKRVGSKEAAGSSLSRVSAVFSPLAFEQGEETPPGPAASPAGEPAAGSALVARLIIVFAAVFIVSLFAAWHLMSRQTPSDRSLENDLSLHRNAVGGNEQLRQAIDAIVQSQLSLSEKAGKLEELVRSDDPLAHDVLVKSAVEAESPELRGISEKAIVERTRRLGMLRTAEQVRQWLRTLPAGQLPASYEPLLKALNGSLPGEARDAELREAYATNPKVALKFASALALDSPRIGDFQIVISQMVGDALGMEEARLRSALALILAHPDLALAFGDDIVQRRGEIPDGDIVWLLKLLADRNDLNVRAFANLAVERGVLSPLRKSFLSLVRDRDDLPGDVLNSLVKAAAGSLSAEDVGAFGRWFDTESERILLGICADVSDPVVSAEAFDIMAGKSLTIQPSAALVEWVRQNYWAKRADFAKPIGVLGNLDLVSLDQVKESVTVFDRYVKDSRLINLLLEANHPIVTKVVLEKYSELLSLGALLNLLRNSDKTVRMLAVRALKPYNDIGALKIIIDHYEHEKDEEVKKVYRETFWMIEKRG